MNPAAAFTSDLASRVDELERRLVPELRPLASVAYNYRWSWIRRGAAVFASIDPDRWRLLHENPVHFLGELSQERQLAASRNHKLLAEVHRLAAEMAPEPADVQESEEAITGSIAYFCAEFGFHASLPGYAGGLGVLAGDYLKEASDRGLPMLGIGLFYRLGYFSQRLDLSGWQQEYWLEHDPAQLPMALVHGADGAPLRLSVLLFGRPVAFQVWCVQVGRVPLLLLDADLPENDPVGRWTTARLYDGDPHIRLAQYGLLGIGGARVLAALGIEPTVLHLNEGHPALAPLELAAWQVVQGTPFDRALEQIRERVVFTTHTPLKAGNESYPAPKFLEAFRDLAGRLELDDERFLDLCRVTPGDAGEQPGMSPLAMRLASRRNGVSRRHGELAREMWQPMFPNATVPIDYVTNGAHLATFISDPWWDLLARRLGDRWLRNPADPGAWEPVREIPNAELWQARNEARRRLAEYAQEKAEQDRLLRGEPIEYVESGAKTFDPETLTLGFARRLAGYKRLSLLLTDPERARRILMGTPPIQILIAGKAHPQDTDGKKLLQSFFRMRREIVPRGARVAFLEDYDLALGRELVSGCDVWLTMPRPPLEASGTSGMKATFNGGLNLSVLDGWWGEAHNGVNGWAFAGAEDPDPVEADVRDAEALYTLLENEVIPLFYERDGNGIPQGWCDKMKESLVTCGPTFSTTRMLDDYVKRIYVAAPTGG